MFHFFINSKNYPESSGKNALRLARAISAISKKYSHYSPVVKLYLAPPSFCLQDISRNFPGMELFAQHLDVNSPGSSTGYAVPEIAKLSGALGSLLNHSEHRIREEEIASLVQKLRKYKMKSLVCAKDASEVGKFALLNPDFVAVEPPELIGSGIAISKARPELIVDSVKALEQSNRQAGSRTVLLCGAGIVESIDVTRAVELGARGILVASGVVKAPNWVSKIGSLVEGFYA